MPKVSPPNQVMGKFAVREQGVKDMPFTVVVENDTVIFLVQSIGAEFRGTLNEAGTEMSGQYSQNGAQLPLSLKR